MRSRDIISIGIGGVFYFSVRVYADSNWGHRKLGNSRHALDLSYVSVIVEKYWWGGLWQ